MDHHLLYRLRRMSVDPAHQLRCDAVEYPTRDAIKRAVWGDRPSARADQVIDAARKNQPDGSLWWMQVRWILEQAVAVGTLRVRGS